MHDTRQHHPDPISGLSEALAAAIAGQINYPHLARCIVAEMRADANIPPLMGGAGGADPDAPYPVTAIRKELGRRGRPMAHLTFQKNYLETGLLTIIPGPHRRQLYVRRGDWEALKIQIQ